MKDVTTKAPAHYRKRVRETVALAVEAELLELAKNFEEAGGQWTGAEIAKAIRERIKYRKVL